MEDLENVFAELNFEDEMQEEQSMFIREFDDNNNLPVTDIAFENRIRYQLEEIKDKIQALNAAERLPPIKRYGLEEFSK